MNDAVYNIFRFGGTLTSEGYNLIGNNFGTITGDTTGNIVGTQNAPIDARLAPLGFYGGATETHALLSGSPAINAGNTATSPATDQRGFGRNGTADMGAFELDGPPPPPVANAQVVATNEDTAKAITLTGYDAAGRALTFSVLANPTNGILSGSAPNLTYTPNTNYNGSDTFTFKANNGTADSNTVTVSITINPVNDAPEGYASPNPATTNEDTAVQIALFGTDAEDSPLSFAITTQPTNGTLATILGNFASATYTPNSNFNGSDSFKFIANDGTVDSAEVTVSITVTAVNDPPAITGQRPVSTAFNTARALTLSDLQVTDIDSAYPGAFTLTASPGNNYSLGADNRTITPASNFFGTLTVPVKVNDNAAVGPLDSNTYQLAMTVNPSASAMQSAGKIQKDAGGGYLLSFIGNPGQQYTVQFSPDLQPGSWQFLSLQTAGADGTFIILDNPPAGTRRRFYRAIIP